MSLSPLIVGDDAAIAVKPLLMVSHRKLLAADVSKRLARLFAAFARNSKDFGQTLVSSLPNCDPSQGDKSPILLR